MNQVIACVKEDHLDTDLLRYLAGYFDGEGCVTVLRNRGNRPGLRICIVSADKNVLELFSRTFNERAYDVTKTHIRSTNLKKRIYRWSVSGPRALPILRALEPYLVAKRKQAILALSVDWDTRLVKRLPGNQIYLRRLWAKNEISRLNAVGRIVEEAITASEEINEPTILPFS